MFRTFLLRYYYRYKIYAWLTKKALELKENAYKGECTSATLIGGIEVSIIKRRHKKVLIRLSRDKLLITGITMECSFTYISIAKGKLWHEFFELIHYNKVFWSA